MVLSVCMVIVGFFHNDSGGEFVLAMCEFYELDNI